MNFQAKVTGEHIEIEIGGGKVVKFPFLSIMNRSDIVGAEGRIIPAQPTQYFRGVQTIPPHPAQFQLGSVQYSNGDSSVYLGAITEIE